MSSTGADFRGLTRLVARRCLEQAATQVLEPVHRVELDVPSASCAAVLALLARQRGVPHADEALGDMTHVVGLLPAASIGAVRRAVPDLTAGRGVMTTAHDHWVRGPASHRGGADADRPGTGPCTARPTGGVRRRGQPVPWRSATGPRRPDPVGPRAPPRRTDGPPPAGRPAGIERLERDDR